MASCVSACGTAHTTAAGCGLIENSGNAFLVDGESQRCGGVLPDFAGDSRSNLRLGGKARELGRLIKQKSEAQAMTRPILYDVARCSGRLTFDDNGPHWCDQRETCARYLTFSKWDIGVVPDYQRIAVMMAVEDCRHKIEVSGNE